MILTDNKSGDMYGYAAEVQIRLDPAGTGSYIVP